MKDNWPDYRKAANDTVDPKPKYKSVMDDPHYDPPDPYYQLCAIQNSGRARDGGMTYENRQAMISVLFHDVSPSTSSARVEPNLSPLMVSRNIATQLRETVASCKEDEDLDNNQAVKSEALSSSSSNADVITGNIKEYED